ncbi:hypothetical protein DPSP01_002085 [Paraphaeosphaeria sporulosa]
MASTCTQQELVFFPKADAAVLTSKPPPDYPLAVGPIFDPDSVNTPVSPWPVDAEETHYPPMKDAVAPAPVPDKQVCATDRYLRAPLTKNERYRLSMVWYYTRDIFEEAEFLAGLQEKVCIAQESTGWEFAVIGILDVNYYTRLATIGLPLAILPRGETICAHTVAQPPGSVFLLPNMLEDWRFAHSPYVESGGLQAYAGAPLRLQNEHGQTACLGSICVASSAPQAPLPRTLQAALARLGDWVVSDIVNLTRARRQRVRSRMVDLIAAAQAETKDALSEQPAMRALRDIYPDAVIKLQSSKAGHVEVEGHGPVPLSNISTGLWEDIEHIDRFIAESNHLEPPTDHVIRVIAAQCETVSGQSFLTVGTKDFRLVFDDIDAWFVQKCAGIISDMWNKRLLAEVMLAKEKFLRGFCHQLRTPIHGILGSVELLAEQLKLQKLDEAGSEVSALHTEAAAANSSVITDGGSSIYLDTIKSAGRDLISIINNMITLNRWADIAKKDRQYEDHTLYDLETRLWNEIVGANDGDTHFSASVVFTHDLPPDRCSIRTDLGLLCDSVLPLVTNALQNTLAGKVVIEISARPDLNDLVIGVKDTGRGIQPEDQRRIFELYEQVDVCTTGAGLGLTLASNFAALLHGSVDLVSSEVGRGSHFRATFHGVNLTYSDSPDTGSVIGKLRNIPKSFHAIQSNAEASALYDDFSRFLSCHGFSSTDCIGDGLIILDGVANGEERHVALSRAYPEQVIICLVPPSKTKSHVDGRTRNLIYMNGPLLTSTMTQALEDADNFLASINPSQIYLNQPTEEPTPCLAVSVSPKRERFARHDSKTGNIESFVDDRKVDEPSPEAHGMEEFSTVPDHPKSPNNKTVHQNGVSQAKKPASDRSCFRKARSCALSTHQPASDVESPRTSIAPNKPNAAYQSNSLNIKVVYVFPSSATITHPTALLVDDNDINLRIMRMYCEKRSLPYICARDGLEAVSLFQSRQASAATESTTSPIQLILMDLQMPKCDGVEATRRIRELEKENGWAESTLFVVTGQDSSADRKAVAEVGGQEYFVKPVTIKSWDKGLSKYFPLFKAG